MIRKINIYLVSAVSMLLIFISESHASDKLESAEKYNRAGSLYREGNFIEALRSYEELIQQGIINPDLFYNASNAAYRSGSTGKAILYLERTIKLAPSDRDALDNLRYLNSIKKDNEPSNSNIILAFLARRYHNVNVNHAALWSAISFALAMFAAIGAFFSINWKRLVFAGVLIFIGVIFLISTGIFVQKVHHDITVAEAIIMSEEANAYSGPGVENTHIFTIHEGTKVIIERGQNSWNLIRLKSGAGGWIKSDNMERI